MIRISSDISDRMAGDTTYHGLRMTAEEYFKLKEDDHRYERIDGVVCVGPRRMHF